jgi:hypothetical protein
MGKAPASRRQEEVLAQGARSRKEAGSKRRGVTMSGHGISDAVRDNIRGWVRDLDAATKDKLLNAYRLSSGRSTISDPLGRMMSAESWKRFRRARSNTPGFSWERDYYCSLFNGREVGFRVWTNRATKDCTEDYRIERYAFRIGNQVIGGGKCRIDSNLVGYTRVRDLGAAPVQQAEVRANEFVPLTDKEMIDLSTAFEFDSFGMERL